jgi:hypothetical protein
LLSTNDDNSSATQLNDFKDNGSIIQTKYFEDATGTTIEDLTGRSILLFTIYFNFENPNE